MLYHNPYSDQTFLSFFQELFKRFSFFIKGDLSFNDLVSDEIQVLVLIGIASSSALVGTFLVLKRMSMLANSLSHTILLGIIIAVAITGHGFEYSEDYLKLIDMKIILIASLVSGFLTTFLTEFLTNSGKIQVDASTGIVFTTLFALGIILTTILTRNAHIGTEIVMGNIDALHIDDCKLVFWIFLLNVCLTLCFFKEYKITSFDSVLARSLGFFPSFFNYLLMVQASITIIGAFRAVGVLVVLAFIVGPVLTARLLTQDLKVLLILAVVVGWLTSLCGVAVSRHFLTVYEMPLSTSGIVVCIMVAFFFLACCYRLLSKQRFVLAR